MFHFMEILFYFLIIYLNLKSFRLIDPVQFTLIYITFIILIFESHFTLQTFFKLMIGNRLNATKWLFIHKHFYRKTTTRQVIMVEQAYHQLQPNNILNTDNNNTTYHIWITEKELYNSRLHLILKNCHQKLDWDKLKLVSQNVNERRAVLDLDSNTIWNWDIETRILLYPPLQLLMPQIWETKQKST